MDKWQAQDEFWNGFGIPAYDENTVKDGLEMPYITYQAVSSGMGNVNMITASLWYRSKSWREISNKTDEIAKAINEMPPAIEIDGGRYKVRLPEYMAFAQRMSELDDANVRRMVLNVELEFLTAY